MAITYNNLYLDVRQQFLRAGLPDPTLESRELVCCASGKTREALSRDGRLYVPESVEQQVRRLAERHLAGEPVAYLIGEWEFYGLPLDISESVLIPRPDTEVLVDRALTYLKTVAEPRVLDLCAGSGCIGLALAKNAPESHVVLGELDEGALRICRQNIRRNDLTGRVVSLQLDAREKPPAHLGEFDCIVSNPPYIPDGDIAELDASVRDYRIWRCRAARTGWTSIERSLDTGQQRSAWAGGCCSRWVSARRTRCCGSCGAWASATWRSPRI